ncbi:DEAD/DEAH box helicase [Telmatospirillum sp. J64-1]|uniref:DEAD/DEAH box helicase n=1 Tax=Telmatospirillum sp. J64-1 TaxID=2502183 RepID=UPI00163D8BF2|nr:DEAD/DEAH box helicase [Telmatospirillum sp. J64-1]
MTAFSELGLIAPLLAAVTAEGYDTPTKIQAGAIPHLLAGKDMLGIAQTGTGKTAAFALPLLQRLSADRSRHAPRHVRALILTPTRELALQVAESFATYGKGLGLRSAVIFGGVGQNPQIKALQGGLDILVATPGRLLDLMNQGHVNLSSVEAYVLDEADRMLDMGFVHDVRRITAKLPARRQTVMFSATMPDDIAKLAASILHNPERVEVAPAATTAARVEQKVLFVNRGDKRALLAHLLQGIDRALVFTRTKHGANRVAENLVKDGLPSAAIHGNKSQNARQKALLDLREGRIRVLVATDIAARGIDIDGLTHVINFDLPNEPESYVHRIGRTARGGADGIAFSLVDPEDVPLLTQIEKTIRQTVPADTEHAWHDPAVEALRHQKGLKVPPKRPQGSRPQGARPQGGKPQAAKPRPAAGNKNARPQAPAGSRPRRPSRAA